MTRRGLAGLASLLLLVAGCWGGSESRQIVNVAPLHELRLREDIGSIRAAFPGYDDAAKLRDADPRTPAYEADRVRPVGTVEWLRRSGDRLAVDVLLFDSTAAAADRYEVLRENRAGGRGIEEGRGRDLGAEGGEDDDRWFLSPILEGESREALIGDRGTGFYVSYALFQKGRIVVEIRESSEEPMADKDTLIGRIARALRPYAE